MDSFVDAETVIFSELTERYPDVPLILCATKCDVDGDEEDGDSFENGGSGAVGPGGGGGGVMASGDLAAIQEEDR